MLLVPSAKRVSVAAAPHCGVPDVIDAACQVY